MGADQICKKRAKSVIFSKLLNYLKKTEFSHPANDISDLSYAENLISEFILLNL